MNRTTTDLSEATLAETEFAAWVTMNGAKLQEGERYELHPCKRVRGFMLRLPGIEWKLWFPTVAEAGKFADRVASIHAADCVVYDSAGQVCPN